MENIYQILVDEQERELLTHGTPLFHCSAYEADMRHILGGGVRPHWHPELEIFFLLEGTAQVDTSGGSFSLHAGEGCFINSNILHAMYNPTGEVCRYRSMVFEASILAGAPGSCYDVLYIRPLIEQGQTACAFAPDDGLAGAQMIACFHAAFSACWDRPDAYEFTAREALSRFCLQLRAYGGEREQKHDSEREKRVKQMLQWMDAHYAEPVTAAQLAQSAGICVRECQREFSEVLHITPMQYLLRRRIAAAAALLRATNQTVSEIGLRCGFDNPSYFAKQFRTVTGMTPREYRKSDAKEQA